METEVENAIELAFNPRTDQELKGKAYDYLIQVRTDPNAWQVVLALFIRNPQPNEVVRLVSLEILNNAIQTQGLPQHNLVGIKESVIAYVEQFYSPQSQRIDSPSIQNKLTQTITYLFVALYETQWQSFFDDFRTLCGGAGEIGRTNITATALYLRILSNVHDEIADVLISRTPEEQKRSNELKDLIRVRDVSKISLAWREILSEWRDIDLNIVEMCLRTVAKWVSWVDIWLVVNETIQSALLGLAGQNGNLQAGSKEVKARDAAIDTFSETVAKKMPAEDKVQLIEYLNLSTIVGQLLTSPALAQSRGTSDYDTDLAETVAKLVNNIAFDLVKILETDRTSDATRVKANELLHTFLPFLLQLFSDEYDEVCSTVIPSLTDLLTMYRKSVKSGSALHSEDAAVLRPLLTSVIMKMRYDDTATWGEGDDDEQTDEAEFQELRKRLYVLQQMVATIDEPLYLDTVSEVVMSNLQSVTHANWRDLDLALYEMYLFGELAVKNGGLYAKSTPSSIASYRLLEMMEVLVRSGLASHSHATIQLQYMEICVRYVQYFEHNASAISDVVAHFINSAHSSNIKVRLRAWYLLMRFIRALRVQLASAASDVVRAVGDLLLIKAEAPSIQEQDSSDEDDAVDSTFNSQLFLFEAVGCIASTTHVPTETKVSIATAVIMPLVDDLGRQLDALKVGNSNSSTTILQIHHIIMAFGALAYGYSDWTPGKKTGGPPTSEVSDEFAKANDAVLAALSALSGSVEIRTAARHSFSRFMGVLGARILPQLPQWIDGLLSSASTTDEMAMFLRLLGQIVFGFESEIVDILDRLLTPLLQKVVAGLSVPASGTDDEIQLKELKLQYLTFILVILNNKLGSVLVSQTNQGNFEAMMNTITHFSQDPRDPAAARLAYSVMVHMTTLWGGPDVEPASTEPSKPLLEGFDTFLLTSLSPTVWKLISAPEFSARDAQMRSVLQEAASLQWHILRKLGARYRVQLQSDLQGLGVQGDKIEAYVKHAEGDLLGFKKFLAAFVQSAG